MPGFLDEVKSINPINPIPKSSGGFLDDVRQQTEQERKISTYNIEAEAARKESERMNSFGSLVLKPPTIGIVEKGAKAVESFATNTWKTYEATPHLLWEDIQAGADDISKGKVLKGGVKAVGRGMGDLVIAVLAPISAALGAVLEQTGGQKLIDKTGEVIADKSGITDMPAFQKFTMEHPNAAEDFNRIMMLLTSGSMAKGSVEISKLPAEIKNFANNIIKPAKPIDVPVKSETPGEVKVGVSTPESRYQEYLKKQGYEPYTSPENLPVIDMGKPAKDSLPSIEMGDSITIRPNKNGEFTYEYIKENQVPFKSSEVPVIENKPVSIPQEKPSFTTEPGREISKQAKDIAKTLDEEFDIQVPTEDLATYKTREGFMADQAQKAITLIESNPQLGMDIAMGTKNAPRGLTNESVYATMKKTAIEAGNTETLINLAKSKVASRVSVKGQEIKSLDVLDPNMTDPVKILQDINKSYETRFEQRTKTTFSTAKEATIKEIKTEIKKNSPNKKSWEDFIEQIKCNY